LKPLLVVIGGPTGIGKTATAINLARAFNTEIISADSRQVFNEMNIGTAVPSREELMKVKHYLIQTQSVMEKYNASIFESEVLQLLDELFKVHEVVIMVGGSGLYIDAVCKGIDDLPSVPAEIRQKFALLYEQEGIGKLREILKEIDPEYYTAVDLNNYKRITKALEVFEITKKPYSSFLKNSAKNRQFSILKLLLDCDRTELYNRINNRVDKMIDAGLEAEARKLLKFRNLTPLHTVGYKEFFEYFDGKISFEEAVTQIKNHSRAYARRQLTWFRRYRDAYWFNPNEISKMQELISKNLCETASE
jgi:tRNA dimethylallyltransferase